MVQLYTGNGKGKTTCAVGLCVRARSRGLRVLFAQFMKNGRGGETALLKDASVKTLRFRKVLSPLFHPEADAAALREESLRALGKLKPMLEKYDLVVLDEFVHLLNQKLITRTEAVEFLSGRPPSLEMVLTGRGAPRWLMGMADLVTEMKDVKHPARGGAKARRGIEY